MLTHGRSQKQTLLKNFFVTQPSINLRVTLCRIRYHLAHVVSIVIPEEILKTHLCCVYMNTYVYLYITETNLSVPIKSKII